MEEMLNKAKHDLNTAVTQKELLQQQLNDATEGRKRAEERVKSLSTDARKHYDLREGVLQEEKRMLKTQLEDASQKYKQEKLARQVVNECLLLCMSLCVRARGMWISFVSVV